MIAPENKSILFMARFILLTALVLRLAWGLAVPIIPLSDSQAYDTFAINIAQGHGYGWEPGQLTAYWPVGTSAIYALLYHFWGHQYTSIMLVQVMIGVCIVALSIDLSRIWFSEKVAVSTGWILACWPTLIQFTSILASELYFIFFVLLSLWLTSKYSQQTVLRTILAGLALAVASYVRPLALLIAPLLFLKSIFRKGGFLKYSILCCLAISTMIICILPWSFRNYVLFDQFVLVSTNGGANFWMGNNPNTSLGYMELPKLDITNEAERDQFLKQQAVDYIKQDPLAFIMRAIRKTVSLYDRETIGVVWNQEGIRATFGEKMIAPLKLLSSGYWWCILLFALTGVFYYAKTNNLSDTLTCTPIIIWGYFSLVHVITVAGDRYHLPSVPFIAMLSAYGFIVLWDHLFKKENFMNKFKNQPRNSE
jgi:hypothetical protein